MVEAGYCWPQLCLLATTLLAMLCAPTARLRTRARSKVQMYRGSIVHCLDWAKLQLIQALLHMQGAQKDEEGKSSSTMYNPRCIHP
jgi:hypothetical protein